MVTATNQQTLDGVMQRMRHHQVVVLRQCRNNARLLTTIHLGIRVRMLDGVTRSHRTQVGTKVVTTVVAFK